MKNKTVWIAIIIILAFSSIGESARAVPTMSGAGAALLVAANDASASSKSNAHYVCDGVSDQVEIQAAIDDLSTGGVVMLSEGEFNTTATITIPPSITLEGVGEQVTIISQSFDPDYTAISIQGGIEWTFVKNIMVRGGSPAQPTNTKNGVVISGANVQLESVYVIWCGGNGIYATSTVHLRLINVTSRWNRTGSGLYVKRFSIADDAANQIYIEGGNYLGNALFGIWLYHASNVLVEMANCGGNEYGLGINGGTNITVQNTWFEGNDTDVYIRAGTVGIGRTQDANEIALKNLVLFGGDPWNIDAFGVVGIRIEDCMGSAIRLGADVSEIIYDHSVFDTETVLGSHWGN